jgi:DNA-directed RNA polymerase specialized sigma24 family protein
MPDDSRSDYLERLAVIREDPQVKKHAHRRAGDPELAKDALQEAYYAMAKMDPEQIEDPRKYFCTVVSHTAYRLRGQLRAAAVDDPAGLVDACGRKLGGEPLPPTFDEAVHTSMVADNWRERLAMNYATLASDVPGRSPDPERYRSAVAAVSKEILDAILAGDFRDTDLNLVLRATYPEWFAQRCVAISNIHQRLARARGDIRRLLTTVISRDELDC